VRILVAYPGHSVATFDVAEGWYWGLKALGHEVFQLNYEYNIPFYGAVCDWHKERNENFKPTVIDVMWLASQDLVCKAIECMPLDFVLMITGVLHHPRAYQLMSKVGLKTALIFTESPYNDDLIKLALPLVDVAFTNDKNSLGLFREVNPRSFYMPHSYNPRTHYPPQEDVEAKYQHDVFFWGSLYEERKKLFDSLMQEDLEGIDTYLVGTTLSRKGRVDMPITNAEMAKHYWGSKIVLSPNRTTADYFEGTQIQAEAYSLGPRVYEVAACGAFQLTDDSRQELFDVFGGTIPVYGDSEHLAHLIRLFIDYPRWREELAERARKQVRPCAFENRAEEILIPTVMEVIESG